MFSDSLCSEEPCWWLPCCLLTRDTEITLKMPWGKLHGPSVFSLTALQDRINKDLNTCFPWEFHSSTALSSMTRNAAFSVQFILQLTFDFLLKNFVKILRKCCHINYSFKNDSAKWVEKEMNSIRILNSSRNNVYHIDFISPRALELSVHLLEDQSLLFLHICLTILKACKVIFSLSSFIKKNNGII